MRIGQKIECVFLIIAATVISENLTLSTQKQNLYSVETELI